MQHRPEHSSQPQDSGHLPVPDLSASAQQDAAQRESAHQGPADRNADFWEQHDGPEDHSEKDPGYRTVAWWAGGIVAAVALSVVAIWQVNEQLYAPEVTAEAYWDALAAGEGSEALGQFESLPDFAEDTEIDHLLLSGAPLTHSAELIDSAEILDLEEGAELSFSAEGESYTLDVPLNRTGSTWGFFDKWAISAAALTWFQVEVPGAPQGGIAQIEVNGEPVNLEAETAQLSAFVPTVAEISIDSEWLVGEASHVVTTAEDADAPAEAVTMDLEPSEAAVDLLHETLADFFEDCNQPVLMPSGCPVGISTTNQVNAETITWSFPSPEDFELTFDADGWEVSYEELEAEVSFDARHFHTGEELSETEDVPFSLNIQVGASGEDLVVSVSGGD